MNTTAITALATLLTNIPSKYDTGFNMEWYSVETEANPEVKENVGHQCGTVSCIAGWAAQFLNFDGTLRDTPRKESQMLEEFGIDIPVYAPEPIVAAKLLGLDELDADILFEPMNNSLLFHDEDWDAVTPRQAAKVLRHLAKTGEVNWEVAFR